MNEPLKLEAAQQLLLAQGAVIDERETVPLLSATGRVLAETVHAQMDQPPFPRSPLDGYAVRSEDIRDATSEAPVRLAVVDEIFAGEVSAVTVTRHTAVRLMTGSPIPEGADCVVRQEDTDLGEKTVAVKKPVGAWKNYCYAGEDYRQGQMLLAAGTLLGAAEIGVLASQGTTAVSVYRKPRVALLSTGDELTPPGEPLAPGKIYDANLALLSARFAQWGMALVQAGNCPDDAAVVAEQLAACCAQADLVVTTGGVSVGKKDIMHEVVRRMPVQQLFWRIAIKPGMPLLAGVYQGTPVVCLSGNPYGAAACMELFVRPLLAQMSRRTDLALERREGVVAAGFAKRSPLRRFLRARFSNGQVWPTRGANDSGILSTLCGCNCMIDIPAGNEGLSVGDRVEVVML